MTENPTKPGALIDDKDVKAASIVMLYAIAIGIFPGVLVAMFTESAEIGFLSTLAFGLAVIGVFDPIDEGMAND